MVRFASGTRRRSRLAGFTLVEVLVAIVIVAVSITILTTVSVGVLRSGSTTNVRSQSAQVLSYMGRRVAGGASQVLPPVDDALVWGYGELADAFPDLVRGEGIDDLDRYRVRIVSDGAIDYLGAIAIRYYVEVCSEVRTDETCVDAFTFGPAPAPAGDTPPLLPGIN